MKTNSDKVLMNGSLFAASNSANGFKSYYDEIFNRKEYRRRYLIKGGPGTGKSRLMRCVAEAAKQNGASVQCYSCSSDPDSLDAVIIGEKIVLLDSTAPHVCECDRAGARDELIDLGVFWDSRKLSERFDEIDALFRKKASLYAKAYRYLSACGEVAKINAGMVLDALRHEKMRNAVSRLLADLPCGEEFSMIPALNDSIGMKGRVRFDTYEKSAEKLYIVIDHASSAHYYLSLVIKEAQRKKLAIRVSFDPILPEYPNSVYFCNSGLAFVAVSDTDAGELSGSRVNMKRFVDNGLFSEIKSEYRYNNKLYSALLASAADSLSEAGESHFELEKIYSSCMDFDAKEKYTVSFAELVISQLKNL